MSKKQIKIGVEVKASASCGANDFKGLRAVRLQKKC